jgi:hypothetical protein
MRTSEAGSQGAGGGGGSAGVPVAAGPESAAVIWANSSRQGLAKFMRIGLPPAGRWYRNQLHVLAGVASVIETPDRRSDQANPVGRAVENDPFRKITRRSVTQTK